MREDALQASLRNTHTLYPANGLLLMLGLSKLHVSQQIFINLTFHYAHKLLHNLQGISFSKIYHAKLYISASAHADPTYRQVPHAHINHCSSKYVGTNYGRRSADLHIAEPNVQAIHAQWCHNPSVDTETLQYKGGRRAFCILPCCATATINSHPHILPLIYGIDHCTACGPCSTRHMTPTSLLVCVERTRY